MGELDERLGLGKLIEPLLMDSVDFISLDNATNNSFDNAQMDWIRARLADDQNSASILTVVVGMHEALPGSKGLSHSMCDSPEGIASGREVYNLLWNLQKTGKKVYVLASHSHVVMDDVYRTPCWKDRVLGHNPVAALYTSHSYYRRLKEQQTK